MVEHPATARDTSSVRALCPTCSRLAIKQTVTRNDTIREATFQCSSDHIFTMRWLVAA